MNPMDPAMNALMTAPNAADYLLAAGAADDLALVDGVRRYTYRDLRSAVARLTGQLRARDLPPGGRVAPIGPNSLFWVAGYLAVIGLDLVAVPLPERANPEQVSRNLELVGCAAVLLDRRCARALVGALPTGLPVLTDEALAGEALAGEAVPSPAGRGLDPHRDAVLMFTSGTTAAPKAVRVTHANLMANTDSILAYLGLRRDDRVLVILPFSYCYGASLLHTHLRTGASLVLCNSFVFPETAIDLLEHEGCTEFAGVPSSFQLLLRAGTFASRPLPSLRIVQAAGGKLPPVLVEELIAAQPAAQLFVMYGQTEATARLSYLPPDRLRDKPGSIGRGIPGVELQVLDEQGSPVAAGEQGEIYARGANISPGYRGDPEGSADKFTPLGLRTGDLAVVDDEGFVYVVDRKDDFIKSWGHRVSSQEVEACALRLPDLVSAAAVGVPDEAAGEAIALFATRRSGAALTEGEVLAFCRQHLPRHMTPRSVVLLDALPLTATGKVAKARLRALGAPAREQEAR
jgi:long-chain acyl-CoA synthetase